MHYSSPNHNYDGRVLSCLWYFVVVQFDTTARACLHVRGHIHTNFGPDRNAAKWRISEFSYVKREWTIDM